MLLRQRGDWYPSVFISNDGNTLITIGSTIVPTYNFEQAILKVWVNGVLSKSLRVADFVKESGMTNTTSGFHWGEPIGFDKREHFFRFRYDDGSFGRIELP